MRRALTDEALVLVGIHLAACGLRAGSPPAAGLVEAEIAWMAGLGRERHQTQAFVAEHRGILVGTVAAGPHPDDDTLGMVSRLHVDPASLGRGVGALLHDRALDHLVENGFPSAVMSLCQPDSMTLAWSRRHGWQAKPGCEGPGSGAGLWRTLG